MAKWFKENPNDSIWWLDNGNEVTGEFIFSFDKKKQYNLFSDYPDKLSESEKRLFDFENPFWVEFFGAGE